MRIALCGLFLLAPVASGAELTIPSEVKGGVGEFVAVRGVTPSSWVHFVPVDAGLSVFPSELLRDPKSTVVSSARAGRYRLLAYAGDEKSGTHALVTVVIGDAPPEPAPGPGPKPPAPPGPDDALTAELRKLYEADPAADKKSTLAKLASLYAELASAADDKEILTVGQFAAIAASASKSRTQSGLVEFRKRANAEVKAALGDDAPTPFDDARRLAAKKLFLRLAQACETIAK